MSNDTLTAVFTRLKRGFSPLFWVQYSCNTNLSFSEWASASGDAKIPPHCWIVIIPENHRVENWTSPAVDALGERDEEIRIYREPDPGNFETMMRIRKRFSESFSRRMRAVFLLPICAGSTGSATRPTATGSKCGGMDASSIAEMKAMAEEYRRLKKMYAEMAMQNELPKDALGKSLGAVST